MRIGFTGIFKFALQWVKANQIMLSNTMSLVGTTAVTSGLGFAFWWVAARQFSTDSLGLASATVSTMMLLGSVSMLGMGTLLITELPRQPGEEASLISTSFVVVGLAGGIIGALFAIFAPDLSSQFAPLRASTLDVVAFAIGVGLSAATSVLDQALIGILQGNLQFWRNAFFSLAKLVVLAVAGFYLVHKTGMSIYMAWALGMGLSVAFLLVYLLIKKGWQGKNYLPRLNILRKLGLEALKHHMLNLVLQVPTQILPVLVTALLSSQMNAWFYVSWMIANFVFVVPNSLTMVLHAMNSADQSALRQRARMTVGIAFVVCLATIAVLYVGTTFVLGLFGKAYADQATWCLRILVLAAFPGIIKNHYISFCRIYDRVSSAMLSMFIGGALELTCSILGAHYGGLLGLCMGWVGAVMIEGVWMFPFVYKVLWPAKGSVEMTLPETHGEVNPIWQLETMLMPAIALRSNTGSLPVRMTTSSLREAESIWMIDTIMQPAIRPATSKIPKRPQTKSISDMQKDRPDWSDETLVLDRESIVPFIEEEEPIWHARTSVLRPEIHSAHPLLADLPVTPTRLEVAPIWNQATSMQPKITSASSGSNPDRPPVQPFQEDETVILSKPSLRKRAEVEGIDSSPSKDGEVT